MLAKKLRKAVVWGGMPAYIAQQYAHAAVQDGAQAAAVNGAVSF